MWRNFVAVAIVLVSLTGCGSEIRGRATGHPADPGSATSVQPFTTTPRPPITAEGLTWAQAHLDPCKLFTGPQLAPVAAGSPVPDENGCRFPVRLPDGDTDEIALRIGAEFDHGDRVAGAPIAVVGLGAYRLRRDRSTQPLGEDDISQCQADIPLSADRSLRIVTPFYDGFETSCAVATAAAEAVAGHLRDPLTALRTPAPPGPWPTIGFAAGAPDEDLDRECQVYANADAETCRAARQVEVPRGATAILGTPADRVADVVCAMLAPPFRRVTGQEVVVAAYGSTCLGRTEDGTLRASMAVFAFAALTDYCYSFPTSPITIAGHDATVCETGSGKTRDLTIAAHDDPETNGVLLADLELWRPRGTYVDPEPDPQRLALLDAIVEQVLTSHFTPG